MSTESADNESEEGRGKDPGLGARVWRAAKLIAAQWLVIGFGIGALMGYLFPGMQATDLPKTPVMKVTLLDLSNGQKYRGCGARWHHPVRV